MINKIFVYGSLKEGYALHWHLRTARSLGDGMVKGFLFHLDQYPALVLGETAPTVFGEVYEGTETLIEGLDRVEGHPDFYTRVAVRITGHGPCWVYVMSPTEIPHRLNRVIPSGRWSGPLNKTAHRPWFGFLNDNLHYAVPGKPHTIFDPIAKTYVVNQMFPPISPRGRGIVVESNIRPFHRPLEVKEAEVLDMVPDEAYETLEGMINVEWA